MINPRMNQCLAQLSESEFLSLESHFKLVSLPKGKLLYDPGDRIKNFLFPVTAKVAIGTSLDEEKFTDIAVIGAEGMIGRRLLIDGISSHRVYVSVAGFALRIDGIECLIQTLIGRDATVSWPHAGRCCTTHGDVGTGCCTT